jgi:hypothetical protein
MYHNQPSAALEELQEEGLLPNPVHIRDMIIRARLSPEARSNSIKNFISTCRLSAKRKIWRRSYSCNWRRNWRSRGGSRLDGVTSGELKAHERSNRNAKR